MTQTTYDRLVGKLPHNNRPFTRGRNKQIINFTNKDGVKVQRIIHHVNRTPVPA